MTDTKDNKAPTVRDTRGSDFSGPTTITGVHRIVTKLEKKTNKTTVGVVVLGILTALHEAGVLTYLKTLLLGR